MLGDVGGASGAPNDDSSDPSSESTDTETVSASPILDASVSILDRMPAVNPFLSGNRDRATTVRLIGTVLNLTLAGGPDDGFFNVKDEPRHEDDITCYLSKAIYFRYKIISDDHIRTYIAPARFKTKDPNYKGVRNRVIKWQSIFKSDILKFLHAVVREGRVVLRLAPAIPVAKE